MIGTETLDRVIGRDVYDESGSKIGSASEVYLDDQTGQPEWVTVKTGLFGTKESFVPLRDADLTDDGVRVRVSKDKVKDAPKIDTDGHLSPQRSEEHTSELQSRQYLVCRLLLEKKKKKTEILHMID